MIRTYTRKNKDESIHVQIDTDDTKFYEALKILVNNFQTIGELKEIIGYKNCNTCLASKDCPHKPDWGDAVRINCMGYVGEDNESY